MLKSLWKRSLMAVLAVSLLVGCSTSSGVSPDDGMTPTAGQTTTTGTTDQDGDVVAASGANGSSGGTTTTVDEDGVEIVSEPENTKPAEPQTEMHIDESMDRLFQNGPSKEEIKRYTRKPARRTYKYNNEGDSGAPLYDDNVEEIIL